MGFNNVPFTPFNIRRNATGYPNKNNVPGRLADVWHNVFCLERVVDKTFFRNSHHWQPCIHYAIWKAFLNTSQIFKMLLNKFTNEKAVIDKLKNNILLNSHHESLRNSNQFLKWSIKFSITKSSTSRTFCLQIMRKIQM